jgi:nucleoside-diphosphate-sugar epimerase
MMMQHRKKQDLHFSLSEQSIVWEWVAILVTSEFFWSHPRKQMSGKSLRAVILGGSGNVGSRLVHQLLNTDHSSCLFTSITLISRRPLPQFDHLSSTLLSVRIVEDLNNLENEAVENYDAGFMLLGAGKPSQLSKDELAAIDCTIPVKFGQYCAKSGVRHMSILSALGADKTQDYSWITKTAAGG